jgi:DNA-binding IscR family transcriptional regulator
LLEIVLALEGSVAPGKCVSKQTGKNVCERAGICPSKEIWDAIEAQIKGTLGKYTLSDMVKRSLILNPIAQ